MEKIKYPCTLCTASFDLQIKLKMNMRKQHKSECTSSNASCVDSSNDETMSNFNDCGGSDQVEQSFVAPNEIDHEELVTNNDEEINPSDENCDEVNQNLYPNDCSNNSNISSVPIERIEDPINENPPVVQEIEVTIAPPSSSTTNSTNKPSELIECTLLDCTQTFGTREDFCKHFEVEHETFLCLNCACILMTRRRLDRHVKERHAHLISDSNIDNIPNCNNQSENNQVDNGALCKDTSKNKAEKEKVFCSNKNSGSQNKSSSSKNLESSPVQNYNISNSTEFEGKKVGSGNSKRKVHELDDSERKMRCNRCKVTFTALGQYLKHKEDHRVKNETVSSDCEIEEDNISKLTSDEEDVNGHKQISSKSSNIENEMELDEEPPHVEQISGINKGITKRKKFAAESICLLCNLEFNDTAKYTIHVADCIRLKHAHQCPHCPETFSRETRLQQHIKDCHEEDEEDDDSVDYNNDFFRTDVPQDEKRRQCNICRRICKSVPMLEVHMKKKHPNKMWNPMGRRRKSSPSSNNTASSRGSSKTATSKGQDDSHLSQKSFSSLTNHTTTAIDSTSTKCFKCPCCTVNQLKPFNTLEDLCNHAEYKHKPTSLKCSFEKKCSNFKFQSFREFYFHVESHGNKPQEQQQQQRIRKRTADELSDEEYSSTSNIDDDADADDMEEESQNGFKIKFNFNNTKSKSSAKKRKKDKSKKRKTSENLTESIVCPQCQSVFPCLPSLNQHRAHVHRETDFFVCKQCDVPFTTQRGLQKHIKDQH